MRIIIITVFTAAALAAAAYFHLVLHSEVVFTHFFYIPALLAALWWKRSGLVVAAGLAAGLIAFHWAASGPPGLAHEFIRAGMLLLVALVVAELSVQLERSLVRDVDEALKSSEEKYRSLFEDSPVAMARIARGGSIRLANRRFEELTGYAAEALADGMALEGILTEGESGKASPLHQERSPAGTAEYEALIRRRDGDVRIVKVSLSPVPGTDEDIALFEDIAERRAAERQIAESEEKYRALVDALPHSIAILHNGRVAFANPATLSLFGFDSLERVIGRDSLEVVVQRERARLRDYMEARARGSDDAPEHYFTIFQREDGEEFPGEVFVQPITYRRQPAIQVMVMDITERKRVEEELREAKELYRATIEATRDFVFLRDREGRYVAFNESSLKPLGIKLDDVLGKAAAELEVIPLENRTLWDEMHRHVVKSGNPTSYEDTLVLKEGVRIIETGLWPIKKKTGEVTHIAGFGRDITERKLAEEAVRESEMRYRTLVEQSQDPVAVIQGFFHVYANEAYCRLLGYTDASELIGKPLEATIAPVDREMVRKRYQQRLAGERVPSVYELRLMRRDGTEMWVEASVQRRDFLGKPAVQSSYRDITERKLAEQTAKQAEERVRTMTDAVDAYLWTAEVNEDGVFRYEMYTAGVERITGLPPSRFTGVTSTWLDLVYPDDREVVLNAVKRLLRGEPQAGDYRVAHADGTQRWVHDSATPTLNERGRVARVDGVCYDITERKQVEDALRQSEEKYRTTFESTGTAMLIADGEDNIILANSEFEQLTGYSKDEMIGKKKWHEMVAKEDLARMKEYSRQRRSGGGAPGSYEFWVVSRDGTRKRVFINVQLVPGTDLSIASCLDITQLHVAEERLRTTELRLASLLERLPNVVLYETGGGREFISENIENLLGYTADSLTEDRRAFPKLIHPDDQLRVKEDIAKWHREGEPGVLKTRFRAKRADGNYIWLEDQMIAVRPEDGKQYMSGVLIDLGEQRPGDG